MVRAPASPLPHRRRRIAAVLAVAVLGATGAACGDDSSDAEADPPAASVPSDGVRVVSPQDAYEVIQAADPRLVVLDVRTPEEFAEGHLADAVLVDFQADDFEERLGELDRSAQYVLYCRSGNRSGQAREMMAEMGFEEVYDVDGGIVAWEQAGLPTV
jgi:rhodanese-related sulfurtransferase